jgi:pimeloyl-ACP methyl ester carboxylesterase
MGASIGANTAINFAAKEPEVAGVLLLSPGLDYRGVETIPAAEQYGDRPIFYAVSAEDLSSAQATRHLARITPNSTLEDLEAAGHGTQMLQSNDNLLSSILSWLNRQNES